MEAVARRATRLTAGEGESGNGEHRAEGGRAVKGSALVGLRRATIAAFLLQCRLAHPQCYGGAAALLSSAPGAAVHLPLPLQVKGCAGGRRGGPAPSLGTLPGGIRAPQVWGYLRCPFPRNQQREAETLAARS